ncbi:hypothetical protein Tco_0880917 [Tanacetum coccineum]
MKQDGNKKDQNCHLGEEAEEVRCIISYQCRTNSETSLMTRSCMMKVLKSVRKLCSKSYLKQGSIEKLLCHPQQYVRLQAEEIKLENIVTNSRVTPSWREIVSLTFSEAGVLHEYCRYKIGVTLEQSQQGVSNDVLILLALRLENPVKELSLILLSHQDSYKDGVGDASFQLKVRFHFHMLMLNYKGLIICIKIQEFYDSSSIKDKGLT